MADAEKESGDLKGLAAFSLMDRLIEELAKLKGLAGSSSTK